MCPNVFCRRKVVFLYFSLENFLIFFTTRLKNQIFEFFILSIITHVSYTHLLRTDKSTAWK